MSARRTLRGSENIALFYVFLFRQKNGSLTIINLYSLGETSLWAFYWWHCLTGLSYIDFGRFQPRDRWDNPCYCTDKNRQQLVNVGC